MMFSQLILHLTGRLLDWTLIQSKRSQERINIGSY